jgi:transcriptional regulator with XRE-family HTH domain
MLQMHQLGAAIRRQRKAAMLTQAELAAKAGISRETLNKLENGLVRDLGVSKILRVLSEVGLDLVVAERQNPSKPDFLRMASAVASVSLREALTVPELIRALLTGKVPRNRDAHLRALFDEAPATLLSSLVSEASQWIGAERLHRNIRRLAHEARAIRPVDEWLKTD